MQTAVARRIFHYFFFGRQVLTLESLESLSAWTFKVCVVLVEADAGWH